eukprot:1125694_1
MSHSYLWRRLKFGHSCQLVFQTRCYAKKIEFSDILKQGAFGDLNKLNKQKMGVMAGEVKIDLKNKKVTHEMEETTQKVVSNLNKKAGDKGVEFVSGFEQLGLKTPPKQTSNIDDKMWMQSMNILLILLITQ